MNIDYNSPKIQTNLRGQEKEKRRQFGPTLTTFLNFVRYWNKRGLLCAVSEHDWSFSNKLLQVASGYEETRRAHGKRRKGERG